LTKPQKIAKFIPFGEYYEPCISFKWGIWTLRLSLAIRTVFWIHGILAEYLFW